MATTFLVGTKTTLRPVSLSDAPLLIQWNNDPETRKYLGRRFPLSELDEKAWIEKVSTIPKSPSDIVFIVETLESKETIGIMGLHSIDWVDRNAITGTMLGTGYRGKGFATDAKFALLGYAFETLGMHKITSRAFSANIKSIEYSKRCGYEVEAILKDDIFREGIWQDITLLACFYENWKKAKEKLEK